MAVYRKYLRSVSTVLMAALLGVLLTGCFVIDASPEPTDASAIIIQPEEPSPATADPVTDTTPSTEPSTESEPNSELDIEWPDAIKEARSGVAHLLVTQCEAEGAGSGFLIDDDLVVTAAHVVKNAAEITMRIDDELVSGHILGTNDLSDIALVRLARASGGHQFTFIEGDPEIGTEIQALGFPQNLTVKDPEASNNGFTANIGSVTAENQVIRYDSGPIDNMIRTDASTDSGNSGGPLITRDGDVVGLVSGGRDTIDGDPVHGWSYAVTAPRIVAAVEEWKARGSLVSMDTCENAPAPDGTVVHSEVDSSHDQATNIAQSLVAHGQAINNGNYEAAYEVFSAQMQEEVKGLSNWASGLSSSYWTVLKLQDVEGNGDEVTATVELWTRQDPEDGWEGQACSIWQIEYTMGWDGVRWLMEHAKLLVDPEDCTPEPPVYEPDPEDDGGAGENGD